VYKTHIIEGGREQNLAQDTTVLQGRDGGKSHRKKTSLGSAGAAKILRRRKGRKDERRQKKVESY